MAVMAMVMAKAAGDTTEADIEATDTKNWPCLSVFVARITRSVTTCSGCQPYVSELFVAFLLRVHKTLWHLATLLPLSLSTRDRYSSQHSVPLQ